MTVQGNKLFPIFLKLEELNLLIIGGGNIALEKLLAIINNSPSTKIKIVAKEFKEEIISLSKNISTIEIIVTEYKIDFLKNCDIVVVAVNDIKLATAIQHDAKQLGKLINVADKPDLCDFYLGSIVKKGDLKIAISTNGKSPTMAKRVKETLDESFPDEMNEVLDNLYTIRQNLKGDFKEKVRRLNEITTNLIPKEEVKNSIYKRIKKTALYSLVVIILMIVGHLLLTYVPTSGAKELFIEIKNSLGSEFLLFLLGGFIAQMIDGALGMAYGVSVTTFLLSLGNPGITPAVASASMHASEVFTTGTASLVYMRYKNINKKLFRKLVFAGILGAALGAALISIVSKDMLASVKPFVAVYTLLLGLSIILKAYNIVFFKKEKIKAIRPLAAIGGFLDSVGGGGWGPIVTATLIAGGRNMRYAVGSSHLAKFFVALVSSLTFFAFIGLEHWKIIFGLVVGGMIAAPFSIYLSNKIPIKKGLVLVGIIVIMVSLRNLIFSFVK